jgi:hypothetical protein
MARRHDGARTVAPQSIPQNLRMENQTAVAGPGFTVVDFTGSVRNNSDAAITFQLTGVPHDFEPYVASFVDGISFPGITLGPGASMGVIDLAIVTLQPFDPSLPYPGSVGIALEAINPMTGSVFTENDASIHAVTAMPEPSATVLLLFAFAGLLFAGMMSSKLKFTGAFRQFLASCSHPRRCSVQSKWSRAPVRLQIYFPRPKTQKYRHSARR